SSARASSTRASSNSTPVPPRTTTRSPPRGASRRRARRPSRLTRDPSPVAWTGPTPSPRVDPHRVEASRVVEAPEPDPTLPERAVDGADHRPLEVVEVDVDRAALRVAREAHPVPAFPCDASVAFAGDRDARCAVDEEHGVRVVVRLLGEVHVVEVPIVLPSEEQTEVAMSVGARRRLHRDVE